MLTHFAGWVTVSAWIFTVPGTIVIMANCIQGLIVFHDPSYESKVWHITLLMWGILAFAIVGNLYLRKMLNVFESLGGVCHVLFWVACIVVITTLGDRTNAKFVFTTITTGVSGWNNPVYVLTWGFWRLLVLFPCTIRYCT